MKVSAREPAGSTAWILGYGVSFSSRVPLVSLSSHPTSIPPFVSCQLSAPVLTKPSSPDFLPVRSSGGRDASREEMISSVWGSHTGQDAWCLLLFPNTHRGVFWPPRPSGRGHTTQHIWAWLLSSLSPSGLCGTCSLGCSVAADLRKPSDNYFCWSASSVVASPHPVVASPHPVVFR